MSDMLIEQPQFCASSLSRSSFSSHQHNLIELNISKNHPNAWRCFLAQDTPNSFNEVMQSSYCTAQTMTAVAPPPTGYGWGKSGVG